MRRNITENYTLVDDMPIKFGSLLNNTKMIIKEIRFSATIITRNIG
jgi:hypothetical protein